MLDNEQAEPTLFASIDETSGGLFVPNPDEETKKRLGIIPKQVNLHSSNALQNSDTSSTIQQTDVQPEVLSQNMLQPGYYQPMQQNFGMQPAITPVVFASEEDQEAQNEISFFENIQIYKIYVLVTGKSRAEKQKSYRPVEINGKIKKKEICIACFLISSVRRVITEEFRKDDVSYQVNCKYFSFKKGKEQNIAVSVPEEVLHSNKIAALFRKAFGSDHIPFLPNMDRKCCNYLSDYILQRYQQNPQDEEILKNPVTEDISQLSDVNKRKLAEDFYHIIYCDASVEMKFLLAAGFGAVFMDELEDLGFTSGTPRMAKAIIVYDCQSIEKQRYITALASVLYDDNPIKKLSQIKITSNKDELQTVFFEKQYQVLFFEDDLITNYSERQNINKIRRIVECVSKGITSDEMWAIPCTAIIFTTRKLTEFRNFADDCIFLDADKVGIKTHSPENICELVTNFLALLYQNKDYFFKDNIEKMLDTLFDYPEIEKSQQNIIDIYSIYQYIAKTIICNYGIDFAQSDESKEFTALVLSSQLLDENMIVSQFIAQLNDFMKRKLITVKAYDRSLIRFNPDTSTQEIAFLYEHEGEELLLFSNNNFEKLFSSPVVDTKKLREILSSHHCMTINYSEKSCFRMPIDERKLYAAVKVTCLRKEFISELPQLHPIFTPNLNDGTKRILLGNDEHGNPLYWSLSKQENRSVLIQGNTRMGKTYFTTTRLIKGLHENDCGIIVFESAGASYSEYELTKCGFDNDFIAENFYHGKAQEAFEIIKEFETHKNRVYIVSNMISDKEKQELCRLLFMYQQKNFNADLEQTRPLFVVFEEAGDSNLYDTEEVKRIYNQGSKLKLSVITILQIFMGQGSLRFRRMAGQASLKVSFKSSTDHMKYFIESIPPERRTEMKNKLARLNIGEAVICGDFETPEGTLEAGCFLIRA